MTAVSGPPTGLISQVGFPRDRSDTGPPLNLGPPPTFELAPLSAQARTEAAARPPEPAGSPREQPVVVALRHLLGNHPDRAVEALHQYDPATQELLMNLLPMTACLTERGPGSANPQEIAHLLDQMSELETTLRSRAPLMLSGLCFCRDVKGFGDYKPLPADHVFRAGTNGGRGERVFLYGELHNPTIRRQGAYYVTSLRARLVVRDAANKVVWTPDPLPVERQWLQTLPHDIFIGGYFDIPDRMAPGGYTLTIQLDDLLADPARTTRQSLDFQVGPDGSTQAQLRVP
jgi:hypothetical protein